MSFTIRPDGSIVADTVEETVALWRAMQASRGTTDAKPDAQRPRKRKNGSIMQRGSTWRIRWREDGVRRSATFPDRETAEQALSKAEDEKGTILAEPPIVPGAPYSSDVWRRTHAADKRMKKALAELEGLRQYLPQISERRRQCVELRLAGKWPAEIAAELRMSAGAVQQALWDGKNALRACRVRALAAAQSETPADEQAHPPPEAKPRQQTQRPKASGARDGGDDPAPAEPDPPPIADSEEVADRSDWSPAPISADARFVVAEDFADESTQWLVDEEWTAVSPTGRSVDGIAEWMLRDDEGRTERGFPSLHPFHPVATGGGSIGRVGFFSGEHAEDRAA